jgi:hypothetical protein
MRASFLLVLLGVPGCVSRAERETVRVVTVDDVLRMNAAAVSPDVIAAHVRASVMREPLTTDRIIELSRDKKLDPRIVEALITASSNARNQP